MDKNGIGKIGEEAAASYLLGQGYTIVERNYRTALGEIDIIAEDRDVLAFVEVRSRQGTRFGLPQETVDWLKQQKLRKLAQQYLRTTGKWRKNCRFDVIGVLFNENQEIKSIELIKDAF